MYLLFLESSIIVPKKSNYGSTLASSVTCLLTWPEPPPPPCDVHRRHQQWSLPINSLCLSFVLPSFLPKFLLNSTLSFICFSNHIFHLFKVNNLFGSFLTEPAISDHYWQHRWTSPKAVVLVQATWEGKWQSQLRCCHGDSDFTIEVAMEIWRCMWDSLNN